MIRVAAFGVGAALVLALAACQPPPPPPPPPAPVALNAPLPPPPPMISPGAESYAQQYGGPRPRSGMRYSKKRYYKSAAGQNCVVKTKKIPSTSSSGKQIVRVTKYRICR